MDYSFSDSFCINFGVIYSLCLPNIYESKALLVPVNPSSSISGALGGYRSSCRACWDKSPSGGEE